MGRAQLVFLVDPSPNAPKIGSVSRMKAQDKFLEDLWEKRTALLVGPLKDAGARMAIVLLDVESADEAKKILSAYPGVSTGEVTPETHTWFFAKNYVTKGAKFSDYNRYWFGTLDRPDAELPKLTDEEGQKLQEGHMGNIIKMAGEGDLLIAGPMVEPTNFRGIFIFRDLPKERIEELTAVDPLIKAGRLKLTLYKMLAPKGTFIAEKQ